MRIPKGFWIIGTDTGVGKTAVTAALLHVARRRGWNAAPMKPVQTGCTRVAGNVQAPDLDFALTVADWRPSEREQALMAPYRYIPACSPHRAARMARRPIRLERIVERFDRLSERYRPLLVEGAGGLLVPVDSRRTLLDLTIAMPLPVVVVARPGLGTLNHTLLTLRALREAGLEPIAVLFVHTRPGAPTALERDNEATIRSMGRVPLTARMPYLPGIEHNPGRLRAFAERWGMDAGGWMLDAGC